MSKLYICFGIAVLCFCFCVTLLAVVVSNDKSYWSKTEDVSADYDVPNGCKVYKVVNVKDTIKSFHSMQCKN